MAPKKKPQRLTPKQKKLIKLLPKVELGELTLQNAMKEAGYADSTAREQSRVMGQVGNNAVMQDALRKAGVDEERLSKEIGKGLKTTGHVKRSYVELGVKLLDAMPVQRHKHEITKPKTYGEIEQERAGSPEEAMERAKEEGWEDG